MTHTIARDLRRRYLSARHLDVEHEAQPAGRERDRQHLRQRVEVDVDAAGHLVEVDELRVVEVALALCERRRQRSVVFALGSLDGEPLGGRAGGMLQLACGGCAEIGGGRPGGYCVRRGGSSSSVTCAMAAGPGLT